MTVLDTDATAADEKLRAVERALGQRIGDPARHRPANRELPRVNAGVIERFRAAA